MRTEIIYPGEKEYAELNRRLVAFNHRHVNWDTQTFQVVLNSKKNELAGGACAIVRMGAVEIRGLWLDENLRGSGGGEAIVRSLEREAEKLGAGCGLLDTYDFQAREFYQHLGYEVFGTFRYPDGTTRYYMKRMLSPQL